jgi:Ca-activated chloride channel homolog
MLESTLAIQPQGGTVLRPGYTMAIEALRATDAAVKHIIVLSDGKLFDGISPFGLGGPRRRRPRLAHARQRGPGPAHHHQHDRDRLRRRHGGVGRPRRWRRRPVLRGVRRAHAAAALHDRGPDAARDLLRDETVAPQGRRHPLSPFEGAAPALDAYVATTLKPTGEAIFLGLDGEPILAVGRAGLGRSAAFTSDLNAWAGEFGRWDELPGLLGGIVRWLQARPAPYTASVTPRGSTLEVVVDAVDAGAYVNDRPLLARFQGQRDAAQAGGPGPLPGPTAGAR